MFDQVFSKFWGAAPPAESEHGDNSLSTEKLQETGLLEDVQALGPNLGENLLVLVEKALAAGEPVDDKTMLVRIFSSLSRSTMDS